MRGCGAGGRKEEDIEGQSSTQRGAAVVQRRKTSEERQDPACFGRAELLDCGQDFPRGPWIGTVRRHHKNNYARRDTVSKSHIPGTKTHNSSLSLLFVRAGTMLQTINLNGRLERKLCTVTPCTNFLLCPTRMITCDYGLLMSSQLSVILGSKQLLSLQSK